MRAREAEKMVDLAFSEEEERRLAWIDHYVTSGQLEEAKALGWIEPITTEAPQWKQYELQQKAEQDAALPTMVNLDALGL